MIINIALSPASYDSLYMPFSSIVTILSVVIGLLLFEVFALKFLLNFSEKQLQFYLKKVTTILIPLLFLIILWEKLTYSVANLKNNTLVLERAKVVPLYQPLLMDKFLIEKLGMKAVKKDKFSMRNNKDSNLVYPLHPLKYVKKETPNIFILGIDAFRGSVVSKETSPNIYKFAQENLHFTKNISGGNCTRFGLFSFFYGINASYWFNFLDAQKGSVLFDALHKLKYQISIVSSVNFSWPEFKKTAFYSVQKNIKDDFKGRVSENDRKTIKYFQNWINKQDISKPIFSFVWLDSVHAKAYPPEYRKFLPDNGDNDYLTVQKKDRDIQFNRYKNSVLFTDALFGKFIETLKEKNLYDNSIIILMSDHGEEFYEYGFYGHDDAYDIEQVGSLMIMHMPNTPAKKIDYMTSSLDVMPTLMKQLGVLNPVSDYSHGKDLLDKDYKRECSFVGNWNENAFVCNNYTVVISDIITKSFENEVRDSSSYKRLKDYNSSYINKLILDTLQENKKFIR